MWNVSVYIAGGVYQEEAGVSFAGTSTCEYGQCFPLLLLVPGQSLTGLDRSLIIQAQTDVDYDCKQLYARLTCSLTLHGHLSLVKPPSTSVSHHRLYASRFVGHLLGNTAHKMTCCTGVSNSPLCASIVLYYAPYLALCSSVVTFIGQSPSMMLSHISVTCILKSADLYSSRMRMKEKSTELWPQG